MLIRSFASMLAVGAFAITASADIVKVTMAGTVEYNQVNVPPFDGNDAGSTVTVSFLLNSNSFINSQNFPVRGYAIDKASFSMKVGNATVGLQNPFPVGQTPYFVVRNNDPQVDGFYLTTGGGVDLPNGLPLSAQGAFGPFRDDFSVTYGGGTLSSLDILGAVGSYNFTGLTSYSWAVTDGGFEPIGIGYQNMTIEIVPAPSAWLSMVAIHLIRRRRGG